MEIFRAESLRANCEHFAVEHNTRFYRRRRHAAELNRFRSLRVVADFRVAVERVARRRVTGSRVGLIRNVECCRRLDCFRHIRAECQLVAFARQRHFCLIQARLIERYRRATHADSTRRLDARQREQLARRSGSIIEGVRLAVARLRPISRRRRRLNS